MMAENFYSGMSVYLGAWELSFQFDHSKIVSGDGM